MMTKLLLPFLLLFFMLDGTGQITFEKQLYSHDISESFSNNIRQTMDGGFVIVGNKNISSTSYGFLMKTNQYGDTTWIKHYKIEGKKLFLHDIILLDDGFLLSGKYQPTNPTNQDTVRTILIKTDLIGEIMWSKKFESPLYNIAFTKITKTENNEFFILVNSNSHLCLTKMDINGEILWQKKYYTNQIGSSFLTVSQFDIVHSNDELYIVLDDVLFKTNSIGDILWKRQYQNIETGETINFSSIEKSNNALVLAGTYDFDNGEFKICFININTLDFTIDWSVYFLDYEGGIVYDLEKTSDNGFIAMHSCSTWGESESYKILKINSLGNGMFSRRAGIWTRKVVQTTDNGFAFVGEENWEWDDSRFKFVKTDSAGNTPCWNSFPISENICNLLSFVTGNEEIISNSYDALTNVFVQTLRAGGVNITLCTSVINTSSTLNEVTCNSFTLNNQTYTESGTYYQIFQNYLGFDSTITLNLTINNPTNSTLNEIACNSYSLNNQTYTQSGTYIQTLQNVAGCDSTITLNVTINNPTTSNLNETACNSYSLNNQTYAQSGTYIQTLQNVAGCDSTITLNVTINNPITSNLNETACNSYSLNNQTYTQSGTYSQTLQNVAGCDSTITLNLTINNPSTSTLNEIACNSCSLNNQTYTQSGTYIQTLQNANGCDSTITLNLTISQNAITLNETACNSYTLNPTCS